MRPAKLRLGDLQLRILRVLWQQGECGVTEVHQALGAARYAYTTVATMLRKMEARKLVAHRPDGRRFVYFPLVKEDAVARSAAAEFVDRIFKGSLTAAVCQLLDSRDVSREELEALERLIAERKDTETPHQPGC
ncbi:MAG: BlaI/MecI/CopY family transcriptional regulator [Thermogutta sp.]|nr:BlaI/MecI/CopY family transcriptional regulator [Thermogutta sp.]